MKSYLSRIIFALLMAGCDLEELRMANAEVDRNASEVECLRHLADGDFHRSAWLAKEKRIHTVALALLTRLEAETDYDRGCDIVSALCALTGIDIPYGYSVPEEDHHIWSRDRLNYWRLWLYSREGSAFLEGANSKRRCLWNDEQAAAFLDEMNSGDGGSRGPPKGADRLNDEE